MYLDRDEQSILKCCFCAANRDFYVNECDLLMLIIQYMLFVNLVDVCVV